MQRCPISLLILGLLLSTSFVKADDRGDAQSARQRLEWSETRLRQVSYDLASAQNALNAAAAQQADASAALANVAAQSAASQQAIADAERQIDRAVVDLRTATDRAADKRALFDSARSRADAAAADVARYHDSALKQFESSPAVQQTNTSIAALQRALADQQERLDTAVRSTAEYADLYAQFEESDEIVRALRNTNPPQPEALAQASQQWMAAKSGLEKLKTDGVRQQANDPLLAQAQANLDDANRAKAALIDRFNRDFAVDSEFKRLDSAATLAASDASGAAQEVNAAEADRAAIAGDISRLQTLIAAEQDRLAQAARDAANIQSTFTSAGWDITFISVDVQRINDCAAFAWRDRGDAARRYREAIERGDDQHRRREWADGRERERHDREERDHSTAHDKELEARQGRLVGANTADRARILAEANARRQKDDASHRVPQQQADRERTQLTDQTEQREKEKQRSQETRDREAWRQGQSQQQADSANLAAARQGPAPVAHPIVDTPSATRREQEQREIEARQRAQRDAQQPQQAKTDSARQTDAQKPQDQARARAEDDRRQADARTKAADDVRRQTDAKAKADDDRRQSEVKAKSDDERGQTEARSRADDERRQSDARARAETDKRQGEAQAREESARRQTEAAKSREDDGRRQAEAKARDDDARRQAAEAKSRDDDSRRQAAEAKSRDDNNRRQAEAQAREESNRRQADAAKAREDDSRRQAEAKSRDDANRQQAAAKSRDDDNRRQQAEAKSRDDDNRRQAEASARAEADSRRRADEDGARRAAEQKDHDRDSGSRKK